MRSSSVITRGIVDQFWGAGVLEVTSAGRCRRISSGLRTALLVIGLLFGSNTSWAGILALTPSSPLDSQAPYPLTTGWGFVVNQTISVNALDYYDSDQNGLLENHEVGIFSTDVSGQTGTLLRSAVIPAGTSAVLHGIYRSVSVTPFNLTPGYYVMAGFTNAYTDPYIYDGGLSTTIPQITLLPSAYLNYSSSSFDYPTPRAGGYEFAANFEASSNAAAVPEPTPLVMSSILVAMFGMSWAYKRVMRLAR